MEFLLRLLTFFCYIFFEKNHNNTSCIIVLWENFPSYRTVIQLSFLNSLCSKNSCSRCVEYLYPPHLHHYSDSKLTIQTLKQIVSAFRSLVLVIDNRGIFVECYNSTSVMLLAQESTFIGKNFTEVLSPELATILQKNLDVLGDKPDEQVEFTYSININKREEWFSCSLIYLDNNEQYPAGAYVALISDITHSVNQRKKVFQREQLLIASASANESLLENRNFVTATSKGLFVLGEAMNVDRCYMFESVCSEESDQKILNQIFEWSADSAEPQIDNPMLQNIPHSLASPFIKPMLDHKPFQCVVRELPESELKSILEMQDIQSLLAIPIYVKDYLWGFVGFDDCQNERSWSGAEISILSSFATSISSSILRRESEDNLLKAKNEAEFANNAKSQFLSNITHEIRTPLHGVIGNTEMLSDFKFGPPEDTYFNNLRLSANTLFELMNNILDFSRIEAGVFEYSPENCSLSDIISNTRASVSYLLSTSNNILDINLDTELHEVIYVDPIRLQQILVNLLSNAAKFSHDSRVILSVFQDREVLCFKVKDSGIGMSDEQKDQIFTPFKQFDSSYSKRYQGTGLGLSITNHILKMMNSRLDIETSLGVGSEFSFSLNLEDVTERKLLVTTAKEVNYPLSNLLLRVLLVEDNHINMVLAVRMITDVFPKVTLFKASNGLEAIKIMENGAEPDIILMDLQMPIMDGFETTKNIRKQFGDQITIIALTASAISKVRDDCLEVGMNDFLSKPFTRENIASLLSPHGKLETVS